MQKNVDELKLEKKAAAERAFDFIESGMILGLGTGSTVKYFIQMLPEKLKRGLTVKLVSTSTETSGLVNSLGMDIIDPDDAENIDVTIDGADEVDPQLNGIKGGGGALLYEKIVAASSGKNIWIVDSTKYVKQLGNFPLPIEVVPFGVNYTFNQLVRIGYNPKFRMNGDKYFVSDGKHYIIDLHLNRIDSPELLNKKLNLIPGVIETGLFINVCDVLIIGKKNDCEILEINRKKTDY